ncbi:MAG: hypothetical protein AAGJ82_11715 [Bacteroidota bacterium]
MPSILHHYIIYPISLGVLLLLLSTACESSTHIDVDAVIMEKVEERLAKFKAVRQERCQARVWEEAGRIADSIILLEARRSKDTLDRPLRPTRPEKPALKTLEDSLELAPLFRDSLPVPPKPKVLKQRPAKG